MVGMSVYQKVKHWGLKKDTLLVETTVELMVLKMVEQLLDYLVC
jgi:hypothetical protein